MTKPHHILVEGVELVGKSFIMNELYNELEPQLTSSEPRLLDGCHWFNCDVGVWGTAQAPLVIEQYTEIATILKNKHLLFEKFHIADQVYSQLYRNKTNDYSATETRLQELDFKIVFLEIDESEALFAKRLQDRLSLYPHYERIAQIPKQYIEQQQLFKQHIAETQLPVLSVNTSELPNPDIIKTILTWLTN